MLRSDALLEKAAELTHARIRRDRASASHQVARLLDYIVEHLFDPSLTVSSLMRATSTKNNLVPVLFHEQVGLSPKAYITDCRFETASRLLRTTNLKIWQIAQLVGYEQMQSFSRAFGRWAGAAPKQYRAEHGTGATSALPENWLSFAFLQRALAGELTADEAQPFMEQLGKHYGSQSTPSPLAVEDGESYLRFRAERIWEQIKDWPFEDQRRHVSADVQFRSTALFELLLETSRSEGRHDRARGIEIAKLALASVEGCSITDPSQRADLIARSWAWIGNAQRIALDFASAERSFAAAEASWAEDGERDPTIEAELWFFVAILRTYQRQLDRALTLQNRAIQRFRAADNSLHLIRALLQRGMIANWSGTPEKAIPDLEEARTLLAAHDDPYLNLTTDANLATSYALMGSLREAGQLLPTVRAQADALSIPLCRYQVRWLEGRIAAGLEDEARAIQAFEAARTGFVRLGELGHAAVVSLDLALVHIGRGDLDQSLRLAAEAIPLFEALKVHRDALAALRILREAQRSQVLTREILEHLHASLRSLIPLLKHHQ